MKRLILHLSRIRITKRCPARNAVDSTAPLAGKFAQFATKKKLTRRGGKTLSHHFYFSDFLTSTRLVLLPHLSVPEIIKL